MAITRTERRKDDPTGQSKRRKTATRSLDARLRDAEKRIIPLVRAIPSRRRFVTPLTNQPKVFYEYQLTGAELAALEEQIRAILNEELETEGSTPPPGWYWGLQIEPPFRQGTVEEVNRFNQIMASAIIAGQIKDPLISRIEPEAVLTSREYRAVLSRTVVRNYGVIVTLSDRTAAQVIQQINDGIDGGSTPTQISKSIATRFDVADSNAKRIADTEINRAFNEGKLNGATLMQERTGQRTGVLHISALLDTTRETHAARHGNIYTTEDQQRWWNEGANWINCKCSTSTALIDGKGNVIQTEDQATLKRERKFFER